MGSLSRESEAPPPKPLHSMHSLVVMSTREGKRHRQMTRNATILTTDRLTEGIGDSVENSSRLALDVRHHILHSQTDSHKRLTASTSWHSFVFV